MKSLVVFYSFEGNTRFVAENVAREIGGDLLELKPKSDVKSKGFMKYFWGGRQVVMCKTPELEAFDKNPEDYDALVIGTPVWSFSYAPAIRSFFRNVNLKNKKIAIFCCFQGVQANTLDKMKLALKDNEIIEQKGFINPLSDKDQTLDQIICWTKILRDQIGETS
ncbi:MAG: flavodoxin [Candidatus Omnitrophica bacterium]|nr:flavodoxin [Candidatus Omnitrophota bacterium]